MPALQHLDAVLVIVNLCRRLGRKFKQLDYKSFTISTISLSYLACFVFYRILSFNVVLS